MISVRERKAKMNIIMTLTGQIVTVICGLIGPRMFLKAFGSEVNGATASIAQFLSFISLFEGGIAGVARAALYAPIANRDKSKIESILQAVQRFFTKVGVIFVIYVLFLAVGYKQLSRIDSMDWFSTFLLVLVISLSTIAQYFIGITNAVFLQADQKLYICTMLMTGTTVLNTIGVVVLVLLGANVIVVKFATSLVYFLRPIGMAYYVRKHYGIRLHRKKDQPKYVLKDQWEGLGQHIAYFVHLNTDMVLLTVLSSLANVSVYSVYALIVNNMQSFSSSFSSGMEGLFGEMNAKGEKETLNATFGKYESLLSIAGIAFLATTAVMIVPFVKLYTSGVSDADYLNLPFAILLTMAAFITIVRLPYHNLVIAAGHFKQTKWAAYGEAAMNIGVSLLLIRRFNIVGVAIGTVVATSYRFIYYVIYLSKNIIQRPIRLFVKRVAVNGILMGIFIVFGLQIVQKVELSDYFLWAAFAGAVFVIITAVTALAYWVFYRKDTRDLLRRINIRRK